MGPTAELRWRTRVALLLFLWGVLSAITLLMSRQVLPHLLALPLLGWPLAAFMATVLLSLFLAAIQMTARVVRGDYPADTHGGQ